MASVNSGLIWRSGLAAALLLAAAPLSAQDASVNTVTSAPPAADAIGPRELSNFSLNGTVTRPAEGQPEAQPPATPPRESLASAPARAGADRPEPIRTATSEPARERPAERRIPDPLSQPPTLSDPATPASAAAAAAAAPTFGGVADTAPTPIEADYGFSPLPWIAALLLLGAGAAIYFGRQRRGQRYAAASPTPLREYSPEPQPVQPAQRPQPERRPPPTLLRQPSPSGRVTTAPPPAPQPVPSGGVTTKLRPAAQPAHGPATPAGVVSTSLRPWIDLEFTPIQANLTDEHASILFEVALFNSGSAPARDVAVEACLINVGKDQEKLLGEFFTNPGASRDKIPLIAPFARVPLKSAVRLPLAAVRQYQVQGRKLFMPMVGINALYRWSSGEGQSAIGYLVGKDPGDPAAKLAPLRVDQGSRGWKTLAARPYERGIRR